MKRAKTEGTAMSFRHTSFASDEHIDLVRFALISIKRSGIFRQEAAVGLPPPHRLDNVELTDPGGKTEYW